MSVDVLGAGGTTPAGMQQLDLFATLGLLHLEVSMGRLLFSTNM